MCCDCQKIIAKKHNAPMNRLNANDYDDNGPRCHVLCINSLCTNSRKALENKILTECWVCVCVCAVLFERCVCWTVNMWVQWIENESTAHTQHSTAENDEALAHTHVDWEKERYTHTHTHRESVCIWHGVCVLYVPRVLCAPNGLNGMYTNACH